MKGYLELECNSDDDCKDGMRCDPTDNTCRKQCTEIYECRGFDSTCDMNKGLCVNGKLSSKLELDNVKTILIDYLVRMSGTHVQTSLSLRRSRL